MKNKIKYLFLLFLVAGFIPMFFPRCANIVPPTGGPRDTIPPEVLRSNPSNFSTGISSPVIQVEFDEFIQLRNINQQFIITPPQREMPEFRVRGRNLYIDLRTDLIPNTTYTLNFGEAIVDLNEGNALSNFEFVFSTGDVIDSLSYSGIVLNAYTNQPEEGVVVMLYDQLLDSVPYLQMPLYANRTGKDGRFRINNLRADTFKVFALKDVNNNYLYDRPGEESIAFLGDLIWPDTLAVSDSHTAEHLHVEEDGHHHHHENGHDHSCDDECSSHLPPQPVFNFPTGDTLYLFTEKAGRQHLRRNERNRREELLFVFNLPLAEGWSVEPLNFDPPADWQMVELSPGKDSLRVWITDPGTMNIDNMRLLLSFLADGPSDSLQLVADTVNMNFTPPRTTRRQQTPETGNDLLIPQTSPSTGGTQELNRDLVMKFPQPLSEIDLSEIRLETMENDLAVSHEFELVRDSLRIRNYVIRKEWLPGREYRLFAGPGAFTGISGNVSDTLDINFKTRETDYYTSVLVNITGVRENMIIQLVDERDNIVREYYIRQDGPLVMDYLRVQNYRLKAIYDSNKNNIWDTGNYLEGRQPERVVFYKNGESFSTRSNWDIDLQEWELP